MSAACRLRGVTNSIPLLSELAPQKCQEYSPGKSMLILQPQEVQYCCVSHQSDSQTETSPGLSYHGHLFIQVKSYAQDQWKNAILHCRELLELKASPLSIIVKEPTGFTLWSEDKSVKCALNQPLK